jgi:uncharacterized membrane protein
MMTMDETPHDQGTAPPTPPPGDTPPPPPPAPAPEAAPPPPSGQVSENRTVMVVLAYLGPLCLIPFFIEKEDIEVQWHAKHGLVFTAAEIIVGFLFVLLSVVTGGFLGCLLLPVIMLLCLGITILHVVCIVKGINGERFTVPVLSEFADKF